MNLGAWSWVLGVQTITWILFIGFFFCIYITWVKILDGIEDGHASYLIRYAHNGWSCDLGIFGIPKVNFQARAFKLGMIRDISGKYDISSVFCLISIHVFFTNFLKFFLNEPGCSVTSVWCPADNLNCFQWILMIFIKILLYVSFA